MFCLLNNIHACNLCFSVFMHIAHNQHTKIGRQTNAWIVSLRIIVLCTKSLFHFVLLTDLSQRISSYVPHSILTHYSTKIQHQYCQQR